MRGSGWRRAYRVGGLPFSQSSLQDRSILSFQEMP